MTSCSDVLLQTAFDALHLRQVFAQIGSTDNSNRNSDDDRLMMEKYLECVYNTCRHDCDQMEAQ